MSTELPPDNSAETPVLETSPDARPSLLRSYLQLFRAPNVFTALADILLGFLITHFSLQPVGPLVLLLLASALLYTAGMVLNDVFDIRQDTRERPQRPLPSGRIGIGTAATLGFGFLIGGIIAGWSASLATGQLYSGAVATLLALCVLSYDMFLKRTPLGPLGMGACRLLNVLLGMSLLGAEWAPLHWLIATAIGIYIVGVTWFARTEAAVSSRWQLAGALLVMLVGIGALGGMPHASSFPTPLVSQVQIGNPGQWPFFIALLGATILWRPLVAVIQPTPPLVQAAVKQCILSLIVLDSIACFAIRGMGYSLLIVALLIPTLILGRWIYST